MIDQDVKAYRQSVRSPEVGVADEPVVPVQKSGAKHSSGTQIMVPRWFQSLENALGARPLRRPGTDYNGVG